MDQEQEEYCYYSEEEYEERSHDQHHPSSTSTSTNTTKKDKKNNKKKKSRENQKRFSDEQVKLLESVFSHGSKLEPRKKLQLATDIGLEPRQVSIWFQNKRARWKTKQLEHEYKLLKNNFDDLFQKYDSLKKEKDSLLDQFNRLRSMLENGCNIEHNNNNNSSSSSKNESEDHVKGRDWGRNNHRDHHEVIIKEKKQDMFYEEDELHRVNSEYFGSRDDEFHHQAVNFSVGLGQGGGNSFLELSQEHQQLNNLVSTGSCLLDEPCCPSSWWEL